MSADLGTGGWPSELSFLDFLAFFLWTLVAVPSSSRCRALCFLLLLDRPGLPGSLVIESDLTLSPYAPDSSLQSLDSSLQSLPELECLLINLSAD